MPALTRTFYLFTGVHSFLLGLLPIFIPVILWDKGETISSISYFISLTALGFLISLYFWDRLRAACRWPSIFLLSFALQVCLVVLLLWGDHYVMLSVGALVNGAAGCFYWSTQRILFQAITQQTNTGNTFGNFQILVAALLKLGVLVGSYLLDGQLFTLLLITSCLLSVFGYGLMQRYYQTQEVLLKQVPAFKLSQIKAFKDQHHSKLIFMVDGLFLFLESYFWVLSIYFLTEQNVLQLGLIIVVLSILLALIFFVLKKRIDNIPVQKVYQIAVLGYVLSWLLRAVLDEGVNPTLFYSSLLLVAFLGNFFRLAMNKRFYDLAHQGQSTQYILCKSYYSQLMLALFFLAIGVFFTASKAPIEQLQQVYLVAAPVALVYLLYAVKQFKRL